MHTSSTDAPFKFNFGGNSDFPTALPADQQDKENAEASGLNSVEVRPPTQVSVLYTPTAERLTPRILYNTQSILQVLPSLELDKVPLTDVLYLLKVANITTSFPVKHATVISCSAVPQDQICIHGMSVMHRAESVVQLQLTSCMMQIWKTAT